MKEACVDAGYTVETATHKEDGIVRRVGAAAPTPDIDLTIDPTGKVSCTITGATGEVGLAATRFLQDALGGQVTERVGTAEHHAPREGADVHRDVVGSAPAQWAPTPLPSPKEFGCPTAWRSPPTRRALSTRSTCSGSPATAVASGPAI